NRVWQQTIQDGLQRSPVLDVTGLAVDGNTVVATGPFAGALEIGTEAFSRPPLMIQGTPQQVDTTFFATFDAGTGNMTLFKDLHTIVFPSFSLGHPTVAVTAPGQLVLAGEFSGTATFGPYSLTALGAAVNTNMFLATLDDAGNVTRARREGGGLPT